MLGVAVLSLLRPGRRMMIVPTLRLWQEAVEQLAGAQTRKTRRIDAAWLMLLAGAVAAVLALGQPTFYRDKPARRLAVEICPSAEIATQKGMTALRSTTAALLDRLSPHDRIRLVLPTVAGGHSDWLSPAEAKAQLGDIQPLPAPADKLTFPPPTDDVRHTYRITTATADHHAGPRLTVIELPTDLPPITFDAIAAEPDGKNRAEIFLAIKNHTNADWLGAVTMRTYPLSVYRHLPIRVSPNGTVALTQAHLPASAAFRVSVSGSDSPFIKVYLVRRNRRRVRVAILGRSEPMLLRYIAADPLLELWADAKDAHVVIANGVAPPAGKPALVINPPVAPVGWRKGLLQQNVVLNNADIAGDDPILRGVNFDGIAVRWLAGWIAGNNPVGLPLVRLDDEAVLLRTNPAAAADVPTARRVTLAFDLAAENTNLAVSEQLVILLANIFRWLSPGGKAEITYSYQTPLEACGELANWKPLHGDSGISKSTRLAGPMPWPGLYKDAAGKFHAVSLVGLRSGRPAIPPAQAVADAPLPEPTCLEAPITFWPWLTVAAVAFWLGGWALRRRH